MKKPNKARSKSDNSPSQDGDESQSDAEQLLKEDHRKVETLFQQYENAATPDQKKNIIQQVCRELIIHSTLEEGIFYPACRNGSVESDILDEAQVEHDSVKILIGELLRGSPDDEFYDAKFSVLSEYVKHHVGEEENETDGIFAKAHEAGVDMIALGQQLQARKTELMEKGEQLTQNLPQPRSLKIFELSDNSQEYDSMARDPNNRMRDDEGRFTSGRGRGSRSERDDDDRRNDRDRDEMGRFVSDDDNGRGRYSSSRYSDARYSDARYGDARYGDDRRRGSSSDRERDEYGRFMSDDDDRGYGSRGGSRSSSNDRDRDEMGRFVSDDDRGYSSRGSSRRSRDDDDDGRGWHGDPRGHAEAARLGWEHRRGQDDDDRGRSSRSSRDDDRGYYSRSSRSRDDDDDDRRQNSGWYGDSRGHSEAARLGWEHRRGGDYDDRDSRSSRSSYGSDDRRSGGRSQGGWFGDSEGHSEAARRGWRNRD